MTLQVVGAGLPRTGTTSLKQALTHLLGGPTYHMIDVFDSAATAVPGWQQAIEGKPDFESLLAGYVATIDWPASAFWRELSAANPDALVVLSRRSDAQTWWRSADRTVWESMRRGTDIAGWDRLLDGLRGTLHDDLNDGPGVMAAYERWNDEVRAGVDPSQLVEVEPADGWDPLCRALGAAIPDIAYPHANSSKQFRVGIGWDTPAPPSLPRRLVRKIRRNIGQH